jgi:hypothetical protein
MPAQHQLVGRTAMGLLLIVMTGACSALGPDLHLGIDNTGPREVTVTLADRPGWGREAAGRSLGRCGEAARPER